MLNLFTVDESTPRFRRLQNTFEDDMTEVYLLFFSHVLSLFVKYNCFPQREEPIIGAIYEHVIDYTCIYLYPYLVYRDGNGTIHYEHLSFTFTNLTTGMDRPHQNTFYQKMS